MSSFKEYKKRTDFLKTVSDENIKLRLNDCINSNSFWNLVKYLNLSV